MNDTYNDHLIEVPVESQELFEGSFLKARKDIVRLPNGRTASREYIVHPGAVVVIPLLDNGKVLLERQYRHPIGQVMTEFPAGKLDPGEDPLTCAQRELLEETGYTATEWAKAGALHLAISYSTEIIHIFFARGLTYSKRQLDQDEFLETCEMRVDELLQACRLGDVTDAKTLSCTLWLQNLMNGSWPLEWLKGNSAG